MQRRAIACFIWPGCSKNRQSKILERKSYGERAQTCVKSLPFGGHVRALRPFLALETYDPLMLS